MRSRFAQLGWLSAGIGAGFVLLTGSALADSTTPTQINNNQTSTSVVVEGESATVVSDSNMSVRVDDSMSTSDTSEVRQSDVTNDSTSNNAGTLQTTTSLNSSIPGGTVISYGATENGSSTSDEHLTNGLSQSSVQSDFSEQPNHYTPAQATAVANAIARAVASQAQSDFKPQQLTRLASSLATSLSDSSKAPDAPQPPAQSGVLLNLNQLLSSSLIPVIRELSSGLPVGLAIAFTLTLTIILALGVVKLDSSSFVGHLRRTGYSHAARSDLASPLLYFVTPQAVSLRVAASPPIGSLFGGVQNKDRIFKSI